MERQIQISNGSRIDYIIRRILITVGILILLGLLFRIIGII